MKEMDDVSRGATLVTPEEWEKELEGRFSATPPLDGQPTSPTGRKDDGAKPRWELATCPTGQGTLLRRHAAPHRSLVEWGAK
jgi:hypothetical protein